MSMFRAAVNVIGNGVATLVIARWEKELDVKILRKNWPECCRVTCRGLRGLRGFSLGYFHKQH
jgi:hypothetical protein